MMKMMMMMMMTMMTMMTMMMMMLKMVVAMTPTTAMSIRREPTRGKATRGGLIRDIMEPITVMVFLMMVLTIRFWCRNFRCSSRGGVLVGVLAG